MPYTINGSGSSLGSEPRLQGGTMWVPLRGVAEALGGKVDFEPANSVAMITHGASVITVQMGDPNVDVDGTTRTLQDAPFVEDGEAWVPVRFFNDVLGAGVNVDLQSNSVDITGGATGGTQAV